MSMWQQQLHLDRHDINECTRESFPMLKIMTKIDNVDINVDKIPA